MGGTGGISATASSGLSPVYSSVTPSVCTVANAMVTGVSAGICTILAEQAGDVSYHAAFQRTQRITVINDSILKVINVGNGSISSIASGINCGSICSNVFAKKTSVTLTATPGSGYLFSRWLGCSSKTASCTVNLLTKITTVKAIFNPIPEYTLSVSVLGLGKISSDVGNIDCGFSCSTRYSAGTEVILTAFPVSGYALTGWAGCSSSALQRCSVKVTKSTKVSARFKKLN